jgi:hypothetical protein
MRQQLLRQHIARFDASTFPSTASVVVPVRRLTETAAAAPSRS